MGREVGLAELDLSKLLKNVTISPGSEPARYLNKKQEKVKKVDPIEEILYDPLYELVRNPEDDEEDEEEEISPESSPRKKESELEELESAANQEHTDGTTELQEKSACEEKKQSEISEEDDSDSSDLEEWLDSVI